MREIDFREIPERDRKFKAPEIQPSAEEVAKQRLRDLSPEANLEVGLESEKKHLDQDPKSTKPKVFATFEEAAEWRFGEAKEYSKKQREEDLKKANELREQLGIPTKSE